REEPAPHRLGLAAVAIEDEQSRPPERQRMTDPLERQRRPVGRTVVDEQQVDARDVTERLDALGRQPPDLVEAGDDDGRVGQREYLESALLSTREHGTEVPDPGRLVRSESGHR